MAMMFRRGRHPVRVNDRKIYGINMEFVSSETDDERIAEAIERFWLSVYKQAVLRMNRIGLTPRLQFRKTR